MDEKPRKPLSDADQAAEDLMHQHVAELREQSMREANKRALDRAERMAFNPTDEYAVKNVRK